MKTHFSAVSILALCVASPAVADITSAEVWAEMQAYFGGMAGDGAFTADVAETGDGLVVSNMQFGMVVPEGQTSVTYDDITLIDRSDGTVEVVFASPFTMRGESSFDGIETSFDMVMTTEGAENIVSGDPGAFSYHSVADAITITMDDIDTGEPDVPPVSMVMTFSGVDNRAGISGDEGSRRLSGDGSFAGLSVAMVFGGEDEKGNTTDGGTIDIGMEGLTMSMDGDYDGMIAWMAAVSEMDPNNPGAMPPLYEFSAEMAYTAASFAMDIDAEGTAVQASGQNTGGAFLISLGDALTYSLSARDASLSASGSEIPFPIEIAAAETGFDLTIPMVAAPEPSGMALGINYVDVTIGEQAWAMFDPGQAIPRDPATVRLDVTGTVQLFQDLMGFDPMMMQGMPGEMRSLSINDLLVSAAGAALSGSGSVEFTPGSFPPEPVGQMNLQLQGLNALTGSLVAAGLVPADQIAMGTAMLGMFARPGAAPDTLESTIDFTPGGGIMANGVPLR